MIKNQKYQVTAIAKYIRMSPRKINRILNQIRGKTYKEALILLEFMPYKACSPIWQVVSSAAANAKHNFNLNKENLVIVNAVANSGPILRRIRPRAKGQAYAIKKKTSHITINMR